MIRPLPFIPWSRAANKPEIFISTFSLDPELFQEITTGTESCTLLTHRKFAKELTACIFKRPDFNYYVANNIHAKILLIPEDEFYIGSSNLTRNGQQFEVAFGGRNEDFFEAYKFQFINQLVKSDNVSIKEHKGTIV